MLTDCRKNVNDCIEGGYQRTAAWNTKNETAGIKKKDCCWQACSLPVASSKNQQAAEGSHKLQSRMNLPYDYITTS